MNVKDPEFIISVDLGQAQDPTAIGGLRRYPIKTGKERELYSSTGVELTREYDDAFHVGYAERFPLHTHYRDVVARLVELTGRMPGTWRVVMDATGVGRPVVELAREAGLKPIGIIITAGAGAPTQDRQTGYWHVPKKELVTNAQAHMQSGRLRISAKLPLAELIRSELMSFKMSQKAATGHMSFEGREGAHDDLVLMLCMGVWYGHRTKTGWQKDAGPHSATDRKFREEARLHFGLDDETW